MGKEVAGVKSQTCELCKMAVAKVDEFIADPTNDVSFLSILKFQKINKTSRVK